MTLYVAAQFVPAGTGDPAVLLGVFDTMDGAVSALKDHLDNDEIDIVTEFNGSVISFGCVKHGKLQEIYGQAFTIEVNERVSIDL